VTTQRWKPIETAPATTLEEGVKRILVWVANGGLDHKGEVAFGCVFKTGGDHRIVRAFGYHGDFKVTHWMNQPKGPQNQPGGKK
jgi:hypothetical protein